MSKENTVEQDEFVMNMHEDDEYDENNEDETENPNDGDEYKMEHDDDEMDEDEEETTESDSNEIPAELTLNLISESLQSISRQENIEMDEIRHEYFDKSLANIANSRGIDYEEALLYASEEDDKYLSLIVSFYSIPLEMLKRKLNPSKRPVLIEMLAEAIQPLITLAENRIAGGTGGEEVPTQETPTSLTDEIIEDEGFDESEVIAITNDIMKIYDEVYAPCFVNKPMGVLTHKGLLTIDEEKGKAVVPKNSKQYSVNMYEAMVKFSGGYLPEESHLGVIDSSFFNSDGTLKINYSPLYHLRNIRGIKADGTKCETYGEFSRYLREDVYAKVKAVLSNFNGDTLIVQNSLKDLFTNCIIIDDFDRTKSFQFRYRIANFPRNLGTYFTQHSRRLFATDTSKVISETCSTLNVHNMLYVFDAVSFNTEILFAYKAQEKLIRSGVTPSAQNVLLGRSMEGLDVTENFGDAGNILISIIAGSRSGKGVVTLSILASLYADDCPVFYADYKPDMASALWNFERKLRAKGHDSTRIFSIDALANQKSEGQDGNGNDIFIKPVREVPFGYNMPSIGLSRQDFSIVPYLKTIQMITVMANLRANYGLQKNKKMFLVLDEAQKMNGHYVSTLEKMHKILAEQKPKKGEDKGEAYLYAEKFIQIFQKDLIESTKAVTKTTGGTGQAAFIILGQTGDPGEWGFGELGTWKNGPFGNMVASTNLKFIGRDSGTSPSYGRPRIAYPGSEFKDERGYFLRQRNSLAATNASEVQMIKTYLVLNENDFNPQEYDRGIINKNSYTGGLLNNITDVALRDSIVREDYLNSDGSLRESIGFDGLMKLIMNGKGGDQELADKMSTGYNLMWEVFCKMGLDQEYPHLEAYLYDCSPQSIFTDSELLEKYLIGDGQLDPNTLGDGSFSQGDIFRENLDVTQVASPSNVASALEAQHPFQNWGTEVPQGEEDTGVSAMGGSEHIHPELQGQPDSDGGDFDYMPNEEQPTGGGNWTGGLDIDDGLEPPRQQPVQQPVQPTPTMTQQNHSMYDNPSNQGSPQNMRNTEQASGAQTQSDIEYVSPNNSMHYSGEYSENIKIDNNPFRATRSKGGVSTLRAFKDISNELVKQIENAYGSLQRIETIEITNTGIVLNDIAFRPRYDKEFIETLPYDVKQDVLRGNLTPLLHFDALYKFKHVHTLIIENPRLAEGRVKREMALPDKLTWYKLLQRKKYLKRVIIGGQEITDMDSCDAYQNGGRRGYELEEQLSEKFSISNAFKESPLAGVWRTRPAKIATGALGATMGVKAVGIGIAIFGGWGLLFGAFAGYGAYRKYVKKD